MQEGQLVMPLREQSLHDPALVAYRLPPDVRRRSFFIPGRLSQLIFYEDETPVERPAATTYPIKPTDTPAA